MDSSISKKLLTTTRKMTENLTAQEMDLAEEKLLKIFQNESFNEGEDFKGLLTYVDKDGLYRLKLKIIRRDDTEDFRRPIALSSNYELGKRPLKRKFVRPIEIIDIVLVRQDNLKRSDCIIGRVIEIYPGKDNQIDYNTVRKQKKIEAKIRIKIGNCEEIPNEKDRRHTEDLKLKYEISEQDLRKERRSCENENPQWVEKDLKHLR
ncbi:hypothetical protein NPIL_184032 [Nephila pilipes]|uniref:DUF5641 domain-containing protein n=1 Tax=Nephila pilipes TaxID=299642 RepID=A0A8X6U3L8_NEPPI|nr:hypothetical protein NPIL_184032 [Nephila pilipes]